MGDHRFDQIGSFDQLTDRVKPTFWRTIQTFCPAELFEHQGAPLPTTMRVQSYRLFLEPFKHRVDQLAYISQHGRSESAHEEQLF